MPTFDDYLSDVVPLFGGFISILGVSEIATRVTAARYGVKLSPSFLVPSTWKGCLGVMNNYESLLPNKKALFDIPVARTASAYLTSLVLAVATFVADGSFNGGNNALYIRPQFFYNNPLLSFIQFIIGPYTDDLGNILPYAVEGVGVPFRKGGHFIEPVTLRKTRGRSHCSSNVWEENCHIVIIRHITFARHWWSEWKCALFAWGLFATFFHGGEEYRRKTRSPLWGTTGMLGVLPLASSLFPLMEEGHSMAHYRRGI